MHQFDFEIDDSFFELFENSEIKSGRLGVQLELEKNEKLMHLHFTFSGLVTVMCDRCLDDFEMPVNSSAQIIIKQGKYRHEETEEIDIIPESATEINVAQYIYEFISLSLPVKKVHPENKKGEALCNKTILKKLKEHESKKNNDIDPRWDQLKNLTFN